MKYEVEVIETLARTIEVDADNVGDAVDKVRDDYNGENIVLDDTDYADVEFNIL